MKTKKEKEAKNQNRKNVKEEGEEEEEEEEEKDEEEEMAVGRKKKTREKMNNKNFNNENSEEEEVEGKVSRSLKEENRKMFGTEVGQSMVGMRSSARSEHGRHKSSSRNVNRKVWAQQFVLLWGATSSSGYRFTLLRLFIR